MRKLHIAFLTPGFAVDDGDTNCVPGIQDFLSALRKKSADITVFTLRYPHMRGTYSWRGIPVHAANGRTLRLPAILPSWARIARSFSKVMRHNPIDVVHSFWLGECAMLGEGLSRFYGLPHIVTLMGQEVVGRNRYFRLLQSQRTRFIAVSQFQSRELFERTGHRVHKVIPWGIEKPHVTAGCSRDIDVLGVGSLTEVKDFAAFLDVLASLHRARPLITCRIIGDGPQRPALEAKARSLGLTDVVQFEGRLRREAVLELMCRARVLLHTSRFESFGLVFAEALACGMSIVSRPVGIFEPGPKWRVTCEPIEMCDAVLEFLGKSDFTCRVRYPVDGTVNDYLALYQSLWSQGPVLAPAA